MIFKYATPTNVWETALKTDRRLYAFQIQSFFSTAELERNYV